VLPKQPDIVLLDMHMPRVDGPAFVRAVRSDPKLQSLPIFALTGMEREQVDIPDGNRGVDRWYVKPIDPKVLVADVANHLTNQPLMVA